uniref:Uncharacterized protein n=1 Tax=Ananas comosus var. bracteatus TaxID=296719 RepID=A0A6V7P4X0_ANACO|nr:unnamed protein product [Ananas comosus var. bracteatus]
MFTGVTVCKMTILPLAIVVFFPHLPQPPLHSAAIPTSIGRDFSPFPSPPTPLLLLHPCRLDFGDSRRKIEPGQRAPRRDRRSTCASSAATATERKALACTGRPRARPTPTSPAPPLDPDARRPPRAPAPCVPRCPPSSAVELGSGGAVDAQSFAAAAAAAANEAAADRGGPRRAAWRGVGAAYIL